MGMASCRRMIGLHMPMKLGMERFAAKQVSIAVLLLERSITIAIVIRVELNGIMQCYQSKLFQYTGNIGMNLHLLQVGRLPCMATRTSNLMEDTLTGRDEMIDVEDVFNSECRVNDLLVVTTISHFQLMQIFIVSVFSYCQCRQLLYNCQCGQLLYYFQCGQLLFYRPNITFFGLTQVLTIQTDVSEKLGCRKKKLNFLTPSYCSYRCVPHNQGSFTRVYQSNSNAIQHCRAIVSIYISRYSLDIAIQ